ncbi:MAG: CRISPR-associated endonuclease Cas1 [Gammaproteobacteria bacterium]
MKPCYVIGRRGGLWVNLDGPALSIKQPERACQLVPLNRISRLIVSGPADISTPALLACAERGISITFLQPNGQVRAYLFGDSPRRDSLWQRLQDFLDRPDWAERYSDWTRAVDSRAHCALCKRLQQSPERYTLAHIENRLRDWQTERLGARQYGFVSGRLHGLSAALAAELLTEFGLGAEHLRAIGNRLDLPSAPARWLHLDLLNPFAVWLNRQPVGAPIDDRALVAFFESRVPRLQRLGRQILNRLHGFLLEL